MFQLHKLSTATVTSSLQAQRAIKRVYYHAAPVLNVADLTKSAPADDSRFLGMTGAEIFHKLMQEHKVDTIFGYPGGAILPVFDAIHDSPHFKFILPRHEQGAGHMAEGYARATG